MKKSVIRHYGVSGCIYREEAQMKSLSVWFFAIFLLLNLVSQTSFASQTIHYGEKRQDIDLTKMSQNSKVTLSSKIELTFFSTEDNEYILAFPKKLNIDKRGMYKNLAKIALGFFEKFNPVSTLKSKKIKSLYFLMLNDKMKPTYLVVDFSTIKRIDNRDFGENDFKNPYGKVPFKDLISSMKITGGNRVVDSTQTKEFISVNRDFIDDILDPFLELNNSPKKNNGVDKILKNLDSGYAVLCKDGSHAAITFHESVICTTGSGKNECKPSYIWSIEKAADYICN